MPAAWYYFWTVSHACVPFYKEAIHHTKVETPASSQASFQGPLVLGKSHPNHAASSCFVGIHQELIWNMTHNYSRVKLFTGRSRTRACFTGDCVCPHLPKPDCVLPEWARSDLHWTGVSRWVLGEMGPAGRREKVVSKAVTSPLTLFVFLPVKQTCW